ncbi:MULTISPECIES: hypothetical protein [unclassified Saccharopolyspora]|uniref:hypothetical protein n=1 Tax=unclassified Saccharopolyspora TaxID=2646250 RepID=UPI001CD435FA|nr:MULTISPECIES: hypothetical protein [unclassified Saccharopolyspora]MCA1186892.1 hypothetical protein [Saccharopolyspora sp. 6T]MCA1281376.1 hypothetical protein [Saccharopolyspora sp. 7B]
MFEEWRHRRAAARVKSGDGRPLKPFRWWQQFSRSLFHLRTGEGTDYAVDVRLWGDKTTGEVKADLYRDGRHHAVAKLPAVFPVDGGTIEVAVSRAGLKRCHHVTAAGEQQLVPDPRSAEGRRARLDRDHPAASRALGHLSVALLVIGVALLVLQVAEPISRIPPIAENIGIFTSPLHLPLWLNTTLTIGAALASTERALRMRHHWLLDGAGS